MMSFNEFKGYFQAHVSKFMKEDKAVIFISSVSKDELWDTYLNSFPEDIRQSFNCNSCRQFIKNYGGLVKINRNSMLPNTIWNFEVPDPVFQQVVDNMSTLAQAIIRANREKYRFEVNINTAKRKLNAVVTSEELWDLSLTDLDTVAKFYYKQLQDNTDISFIGEPSKSDVTIQTKLDVIKYIIAIKKEEAEAVKALLEKAQKKKQLAELIAQKQNEVLSSKSLDELQAELNSL